MAKFVFSPRLPDVYKDIEYLLEGDPAEPLDSATRSAIPPLVALLEERDSRLEDSLLGNLIVTSVQGTAGSVNPAAAKQIGWSMNAGAITGTPDVSGFLAVLYDVPFATDTVVVVYFSSVQTGNNFLGFPAQILKGSVSRTGFTVVDGDNTAPIAGGYLAIGF